MMKNILTASSLIFILSITSVNAGQDAIKNLQTVQQVSAIAATIPAATNFISYQNNDDLRKIENLATLGYIATTSALEQGIPMMTLVKILNTITKSRIDNAKEYAFDMPKAILLDLANASLTITAKGTTARVVKKKINSDNLRILRRIVRAFLFATEEAVINETMAAISATLNKSFDAQTTMEHFIVNFITLLMNNAGGELIGEILIATAEDKAPGDSFKNLINEFTTNFSTQKTRSFDFTELENAE